jgi:hypothetical protein
MMVSKDKRDSRLYFTKDGKVVASISKVEWALAISQPGESEIVQSTPTR